MDNVRTQSDQDVLKLTLNALAGAAADRAADGVPDETVLREMISHTERALKGRVSFGTEQIEDLIDATRSKQPYAAGVELSKRAVARWFEIPEDDFEVSPLSSLQPDVLGTHVYYEKLVSSWFVEWGYEVGVGEVLEGLEGADFIPDVFAELETLHGSFQVAVSLFCQPTNTSRVLGMLENIEAYATKGSDFGARDIFMLVTPFKFLEQATNHIRVQSHQEDYFVIAIEANELYDLENAPDSFGRKERLAEIVKSGVSPHLRDLK